MAKSIGSLAEEIMNNEFAGDTPSPLASSPFDTEEKQLDIRGVTVPNSFMASILSEETQEEDKLIEPVTQQVQDSAEPEVNLFGNPPEKAQHLMDRLQALVDEAEGIISEMTAVGALGVGSGKKLLKASKKKSKRRYTEEFILRMLKEKDDNPWAICHASTGPKKTSKFERCVKHIKAKGRGK